MEYIALISYEDINTTTMRSRARQRHCTNGKSSQFSSECDIGV